MRRSFVSNVFREDKSRKSNITFYGENVSCLTKSENLVFQGIAKRDGDQSILDDMSSMNMSNNDFVVFQKNTGRSGFAPSPNPGISSFYN